MNEKVTILPRPLRGRITVPPSKSAAHRLLICAALAQGKSEIKNMKLSEDIAATIGALSALGCRVKEQDGVLLLDGLGGATENGPFPEKNAGRKNRQSVPAFGKTRDKAGCAADEQGSSLGVENIGGETEGPTEDFAAKGIEAADGISAAGGTVTLDCGESGSTLRFLIPVALALGGTFRFTGRGRLLSRPLGPYFALCEKCGIEYRETENGVTFSGKLSGGEFSLAGNVSSQFITGLLFALPLAEGASRILVTTPLESAGYVDMTLGALKTFGIDVQNNGYREFLIRGGQKYRAANVTVEGDYSQAAFYLVANALGSEVEVNGLDERSLQGDREIVSIIEKMGVPLRGLQIDASQIPDLVPILAVLATQAEGVTEISNAARLRLKESDRLAAITQELKKLGADITETPDSLIIRGKTPLSGGVLDAHNDHRIAMASAIAATVAGSSVTIVGSGCVKKSYAEFWDDYRKLGGVLDV